MDREQHLIDAAMRFQALLDRGQVVNVREFVAAEPPELRDDLRDYLELLLTTDAPAQPLVLTAEEQALADRVAKRTHAKLRQQMAATTPASSLTALRKARNLSLGQLARQINLPVDLLQRIERGGVVAATIPGKLTSRIAQALQRAEAEVQAALGGSQLRRAGVRLSAQDGTAIKDEQAVAFADAIAASTATDAQKAEWQ